MRWLRDASVRRKLTAVTTASAGVALLLACAAFVAYELLTFRAAMVRNLSAQAQIVGRQSTSALVFKDPDSAAATLGTLRAEPHVVSAGIYTVGGTLFASYVRDGPPRTASVPRPPAGRPAGHAFERHRLVLFRPIEFDNSPIGTVLIESDLGEMTTRLQRYAAIVPGVLIVSIIVAYWTASRLQRLITGPVLDLAHTARQVSSHRDYSVRAVAHSGDELGLLVRTFNHMLDQIQERDTALQAARGQLELQVDERTRDLQREIADRKLLEGQTAALGQSLKRLAESEEQYRLLFAGNPHPMWVYDEETLAFLAVNDATIIHYGYSHEEFLGMTLRDICPPGEVEILEEEVERRRHERALKAFDSPRVWKHRKKDGTLIDVEISASPIEFRGRTAWLVHLSDVTEKRGLEAQLLQSQKMESMGRLAGGIAHDFNNLLGIITGYGDLLRRRVADDSRLTKYVDDIVKAADRAAGLTRQLLAFSRKQVLQPRILYLNAVVDETQKMLRRIIGEDIQLAAVLDEHLGPVRADPGQIDQILMNLAVNARDAMPRGGRLTIETGNVTLDESYARQHAGVEPGHYVMLAVSDTGHGMTPDVQNRVFEPFFTTKAPGKGTGLGLATVHGIVKQSGGHIFVYSEPGHGTSFKVYLPRTDAGEVAARLPESTAQLPRGSETIVLVEDEASLRELVRECLEATGYTVLEARHGADALEICEHHDGPIDLLVTDVVMPQLSGRQLGEWARGLRPDIRVLYMSGYTDDAVVLHGVLAEDMAFLQKPFTAEALARKVRELLDQPTGKSS